MKQELRAIRGMNDVAPPASARWQALEQRVAEVLAAYGYQQIRLPIVEATGVFERSIGDTTDIVQYTNAHSAFSPGWMSFAIATM